MNLKLLNEVDELLDSLVAECYEQLESADDNTSANQILLNSINNISTKLKTNEIKRQQGMGYVNRESVLFDAGDEMPLPLFPEVFDDNED